MLKVILAVCLMWLLCYILTVTNVFPTDPSEYGYAARTDIRTDAIAKADWFRFPYPGNKSMFRIINDKEKLNKRPITYRVPFSIKKVLLLT